MSIEEIINHLDVLARVGEGAEEDGSVRDINGANAAALRQAIALLRTHPEAQPNEPLTLEELKEMDGQPVWMKSKHFTGWGIVHDSQFDIAFYAADGRVYFAWTSIGYNERLGAKIFRRPPKED